MADTASRSRVLVATGAAVADVEELPELVRVLLDSASEVFVITPILADRLQWLVSDTDEARYRADERLNTVLGQLEELDVSAEGQVGDETPLTALEDAVRVFSPDHILIGLREHESAGWQERGLVHEALERFKRPVTVFEIDAEGRVPTPDPGH